MRRILWTAVLSLCIVGTAIAQDACPAIIQDALSAIADNCSNLERNTACYGFNQVNAEFSAEHPANYFSQETDQAELTDLTALQTSPLNEATEEFGAAVMNLQANVPDSIPGQGVVFLLLGDTRIENAVDADKASEPIKAVAVQTANDATIYTLPSNTASTLEQVTAGQTLNVDGTNTNGEWVRVIINEKVGWIARTDLTPSDTLASLPDVGATTRTPMQAFYFTTGIGLSGCNEADSTITVQSPENIQVDLSVNGVDIRVGSLVTFTQNSLTVHRGHVETSGGQVVNANETLTFENRDDNGNWTGQGELRKIVTPECERGTIVEDVLNEVAKTNGWDPNETDPCQPGDGSVIPACTDYVVQRGDTLFRIAFRQSADMKAIADQNALTPPYTLFVGQTLCIPNVGGGFASIPGYVPTNVPPTNTPNPNGVAVTGSTIVGPNTAGGYGAGAVTIPDGGSVAAVFTLYGFGYTSQLGSVGSYDCSRTVLYRVEGDARATKQAYSCDQGAITTTSVGTGDYLIIIFPTAGDAANSPSSFSLLTGQ